MKTYCKVLCIRNSYSVAKESSAFSDGQIYEGWLSEDGTIFDTDCDSNGRENGWGIRNFTILESGNKMFISKKVINQIKSEIGL